MLLREQHWTGGTNNDYQTVDRFKLVATGHGRVTMSQADSGLSDLKCLKRKLLQRYIYSFR